MKYPSPEKIVKVWIDPLEGFRTFQLTKLVKGLGLQGDQYKKALTIIKNMYICFKEKDISLLEINPLIETDNGEIIAVDAKMNFDSNALFRHSDVLDMRDVHEEEETEYEASKFGLNYINLDGNVGCMVNGAGLAMATMDLIKQAGGEPANFLDVGGTADSERSETAFRIIIKDPNVKAILVNIFGGIVRCDRVANGIVDACKNMKNEISVPIIVRLEGTNSEIAKEIIDSSGLNFYSAVEFKEAADKVQKVLATA
jgi:succinyl-CoA synthetase beta subunit